MDHTYSLESPRKLKRKMDAAVAQREYKHQLQLTGQREKQLQMTISSVLEKLNAENLLSVEMKSLLDAYEDIPIDLFQKPTTTYSEEQCLFATTLHLCGEQAYEFARKHMPLPNPRTLRRFPLEIPQPLERRLRAMGRKCRTAMRNSFVCSEHFTADSYKSSCSHYLKDDAVPPVSLSFPKYMQKKPARKRRIVLEHLTKDKKKKTEANVLDKEHSSNDMGISSELEELSTSMAVDMYTQTGTALTNDAQTQCILRMSCLKPLFCTLPLNLIIRVHGSSGNDYSVWCKKAIAEGMRFGPYEATISACNDKHLKDSHCQGKALDKKEISSSQDELTLNWLAYINCTSDWEQQNLIMYEYKGQIFCISTKHIPAGMELLIWRSDKSESGLRTRWKNFRDTF